MPPKNASKGGGAASKKTEQKKKDKVIEDKTFGLKNKKGSKQQKFIQQVQKTVQSGGNKTFKDKEKEREEQKKLKEQKKNELLELCTLFKPVQQKVAEGVDPKSVLCAAFKVGTCTRGVRCKFSHDLGVERKSEKRSVYCDVRDTEQETSADWDDEKLQEVMAKKQEKEKNKVTTNIVCKFFLDAVESGKYGWFWNCPNGDKCSYKHALAPGYVLKKDKKKMDREKEQISLEDLIERERASLGVETTKVTLDTFLAWKKKKLKEREEQEKKATARKKRDYKSGKEGGISGREMFTFNPELAEFGFEMEEGDADFDLNNIKKEPVEGEEEEETEEIHYKEINFSNLLSSYKDVDNHEKMSVASSDRIDTLKEELKKSGKLPETNGTNSDDIEGAVAIDEDLFDGDDEDLDDLEEQLEELAVAS